MAKKEETGLPENQGSVGLTPARDVFPMADYGQSYGKQQAEKNLRYWQGMSGRMREPSALASPEERKAYTAQEVRSGNLPEYMLPEAYGGMPRGTSRRAYRARQQWMAEQNYINEVRAQQAQAEQAAFERNTKMQQEQRAQESHRMNLYKAQFEAERQTQIAKNATGLMDLITGNAKDADGNLIPPIRPQDPNARERLRSAFRDFPLALEDKNAQELIERFDSDLELYAKAREEVGADERQKIINDAIAAGVSDEQIAAMQKPDPATGSVGYDYAGIQRLAAETKRSERTRQTQEKGAYRPASLAEAEDQLAEAEAELGALTPEEGGEGSEAYTNAKKRVASLKERVKRAAQREGVQLPSNEEDKQPKKEGDKTAAAGYVVGKSYQGLTYLGGDPTKSENWKKTR